VDQIEEDEQKVLDVMKSRAISVPHIAKLTKLSEIRVTTIIARLRNNQKIKKTWLKKRVCYELV